MERLPNDTDCGISFEAGNQGDSGPFQDAAIFQFVGENGADVSADASVDDQTALATDGAQRVACLHRVDAGVVEFRARDFQRIEVPVNAQRMPICSKRKLKR